MPGIAKASAGRGGVGNGCNPAVVQAAFDVAGAGNVARSRWCDTGVADKAESLTGCKSLYRQLPVFGRLAYPERAEVTKHDMPGRKSLGCPVGRLAAVGAIWETTQTQRPEHNEMSASSKTSPRKVAFAERNGKPTHSVLGKADDIEEETGTSTRWDRRGRGPGIWGKICRDRVGKNPLAAGAGSNLQRLSERGE